MIYQLKKNTKNQATEQISNTPVASPSKFQRTSRRGLKSAQESNIQQQKSETVQPSLLTQQNTERPKIISRTGRNNRQLIRSPHVQQVQNLKMEKMTNPTSINPSTIQTPARSRITSEIKVESRVTSNVSQVKKQTSPASSKITPINSSRLKTMTQEKLPQQNVAVLKKTSVVGLVFNRLLKRNSKFALQKLRQNKFTNKRKNISESKCLILCTCQLARRYELSNYHLAFQRFKLLAKNGLKEQSNKSKDLDSGNLKKSRQNIANILNLVYRTKIRSVFECFRSKNTQISHASFAINTLKEYQKKKLSQYWKIFKNQMIVQGQKRKYLLNYLTKSYNICSKNALSQAFIKIQRVSNPKDSIPQQVRPRAPSRRSSVTSRVVEPQVPVSPRQSPQQIQLSTKIQNLHSANNKLNEQFKEKEQEIKERKKQNEQNIKTAKKNIQDLKQTKNKMQKQLQSKKNEHNSIKNKVSLKVKSLSSDDLNEAEDILQADRKLRTLQQVYSEIYKMNDDDINSNIQKVLRESSVDSSVQSELTQQWSLITQKASLQKQIDIYETSILGLKSPSYDNNSVLRTVRQENELVSNMIRNFIKERYLWGQVQKFVSIVL